MIRRNFLTALAAGAALGAGMGSKRLIAQAATGPEHPLWSLWEAWRFANLEFFRPRH